MASVPTSLWSTVAGTTPTVATMAAPGTRRRATAAIGMATSDRTRVSPPPPPAARVVVAEANSHQILLHHRLRARRLSLLHRHLCRAASPTSVSVEARRRERRPTIRPRHTGCTSTCGLRAASRPAAHQSSRALCATAASPNAAATANSSTRCTTRPPIDGSAAASRPHQPSNSRRRCPLRRRRRPPRCLSRRRPRQQGRPSCRKLRCWR